MRTRLSLVALGAVSCLLSGCPQAPQAEVKEAESAGAPPITLIIALQPSSALALIAEEEGYFTAEGVAVRIKHAVSGKRGLQSVLLGEGDMASSADVPIAVRYFTRSDLRIIGTIASAANEPRIVARADRGIREPEDLRGKRVATQKASAVHFFLHAFLVKHGIRDSDVQLSFMKAEDLPEALARGDIDAFSMREPQVTRARELLKDNVVIFDAPGLYERTEDVVCLEKLTRSRPRAIQAILAAFIRSQELVREDQERAARIVAKKLNVDPDDISRLWQSYDLRVRIDQSLLHTLEDIARWAIGDHTVTQKRVPNYLGVLYLDGLDEIDPDAVTVIR